jgi:hypothetical protein
MTLYALSDIKGWKCLFWRVLLSQALSSLNHILAGSAKRKHKVAATSSLADPDSPHFRLAIEAELSFLCVSPYH